MIGPSDSSGVVPSSGSSAAGSLCSSPGMAVRLPGRRSRTRRVMRRAGQSDPAWAQQSDQPGVRSTRWKDGGVTVEAIRSGIDLSNVDAGARPQDDLFGHVNGRWLAGYKIPADRATDGAFP